MRKYSSLPPLAALALGVVGFFNRKNVLNTCFDAVGLPVTGARTALYLLLFTLAVAVACAAFSFLLCRKVNVPESFTDIFSPSLGTVSIAFNCLIAAAMITACAVLWTSLHHIMPISMLQLIFFIFAFLAAISFIVVSVCVFRGKSTPSLRFFSVMPSLFFCAWLIIYYKDNSINPSLLDFAYQCLAIASAALSFYYASGFCFGKQRNALYLGTSLLAIYLCSLSAADVAGTPFFVFYIVTVLEIIVNTAHFIANLSPEKKQ